MRGIMFFVAMPASFCLFANTEYGKTESITRNAMD